MTAIPEIDVETLEAVLAGDALLIDVREPDEYEDGHIGGALLMPLATVPDRLPELPVDSTIHLVCAMGGRSARAVEFLRAQGFDAVNVRGGTQGWIESGRAVVRGAERS